MSYTYTHTYKSNQTTIYKPTSVLKRTQERNDKRIQTNALLQKRVPSAGAFPAKISGFQIFFFFFCFFFSFWFAFDGLQLSLFFSFLTYHTYMNMAEDEDEDEDDDDNDDDEEG